MRRFPAPFAALLQERAACGGLLISGVILVAMNALGFSAWRCVFHDVTGLPCPGCGLTRGMTALCHGDLAAALRWNPFTPVVALGGLMVLLATALPVAQRDRLTSAVHFIESRTGITLWVLAAMMVFGVWRMFGAGNPGL